MNRARSNSVSARSKPASGRTNSLIARSNPASAARSQNVSASSGWKKGPDGSWIRSDSVSARSNSVSGRSARSPEPTSLKPRSPESSSVKARSPEPTSVGAHSPEATSESFFARTVREKPTAAPDPQALPPNGTFADLVLSVVKTPNPQDDVRGQPGEKLLLDKICRWFEARKIKYEADVSWGVHAVLTGPGGAGSRPGLLLSAHLDSDHFRLEDLAALRVEGDQLICPGQVGLDCKTGVAIILSVLQRLQESASRMPRRWQVHVMFHVGEEAGQKGAFRAPLPRLIAGKVRHAIVVDRMTSGAGAPRDKVTRKHVRHAVTSYKGVPLLDESGPELMEHLGRGLGSALGTKPQRLPTCESPNCADALELRGRHVAEVAAPQLLEALRAKGSALS